MDQALSWWIVLQREVNDMIRKIAGGLLLTVGVLVGLMLLTYGGPVFPHIIGPTVLVLIGAALLWLKRLPFQDYSGTKKLKRM